VLLMFTAACLSLKMAIAPGFMIGQTCFVLCWK
jgi:hypothetical protein